MSANSVALDELIGRLRELDQERESILALLRGERARLQRELSSVEDHLRGEEEPAEPPSSKTATFGIAKLVEYLESNPGSTCGEIAKGNGITNRYVSSVLANAKKASAIFSEGEWPHCRYHVKERTNG